MLKPSDLHALSPLGQGPGTRVWKGLDAKGQPLLLKTFSLAEAPNWKAEELFDREAKVLQHLDHPCLPQLLAYGVEDQTSYLIYRFIEGESLQAKLEAGWRPSLDEVLASLETALLAPSVPEKIALSIPNSKQKELDLFRNWPTPIPETGMNAIEVKKVPQGISILLPRREKTNSTLYFLSLTVS